MTRRRVLVVIGTRPEAIKLAPVLRALRAKAWAATRVLATAQHRALLDQALAAAGIPADRDLDVMRADASLAELTARLLVALDPVLRDEAPDLVLAQGDTTTVLAAAMACAYRGIAFGHVEAGLRTGDLRQPFPEELNRVLVARIANLHFAPTEQARTNLLREGVADASIHVTGNTGIDALQWTAARSDPRPFAPPLGRRLVLVTAHRRENFGEPLVRVCTALRQIAARGDVQILFVLHPNPNAGSAVQQLLADHPAIRLSPPLDHVAMVSAMRASHLILTDSGGMQEEAPMLGKPLFVLRDTTERPEGVTAGGGRLVGTDPAAIAAAVTALLDDPVQYERMAHAGNPYGDGRAAERIVAAIGAFLRTGP